MKNHASLRDIPYWAIPILGYSFGSKKVVSSVDPFTTYIQTPMGVPNVFYPTFKFKRLCQALIPLQCRYRHRWVYQTYFTQRYTLKNHLYKWVHRVFHSKLISRSMAIVNDIIKRGGSRHFQYPRPLKISLLGGSYKWYILYPSHFFFTN